MDSPEQALYLKQGHRVFVLIIKEPAAGATEEQIEQFRTGVVKAAQAAGLQLTGFREGPSNPNRSA